MTTQDLGTAARQLSEMEAAYKDTFEDLEAKFAGAQAEAAGLRTERDTAHARIAELETETTRRAQEAADLRTRLDAATAASDALKQERDGMQKLSAERIAELVSRDLVQRAFEVLDQGGNATGPDAVISATRVARVRCLLAEALGR